MPNDLVERPAPHPFRAAEHAIHCEDGAATVPARPLERIVRPHRHNLGNRGAESLSTSVFVPKRDRNTATARTRFRRNMVRTGPEARRSSVASLEIANMRNIFSNLGQSAARK